jgi:hypothetical protein
VRAPAVHFMAVGAALHLAGVLSSSSPPEPLVITVPQAMVERLGVGTGGTTPGGALDAWLEDEVLYREGVRRGLAWNPGAIAHLVEVGRFVGDSGETDAEVLADVKQLGLDRADALVRAQVVGRMRLLLFDRAMQAEPTDRDLEAYLASHRSRFLRPARATFVHVLLSRDRAHAQERATALAKRVQAGGVDREDAIRLGDVFRLGERFEARTSEEVAAIFGAEVARAAMTAPERRWSDPVPSPYGWHLVQVQARTEERLPPLDAIRDQVRTAWRSDHARHAVGASIRELRARYRTEIATSSAAPSAPRFASTSALFSAFESGAGTGDAPGAHRERDCDPGETGGAAPPPFPGTTPPPSSELRPRC